MNTFPFYWSIVKNNKIDIVITLFDIDLLVLARNKKLFADNGISVIVSEPEVIEICNDKWKTYKFLCENGFHTPKTFLSLQQTMLALDKGELNFPIIVKPRFGCGSIALSVAENEMALLYYYRHIIRKINDSYLKYELETEQDIVLY